MTKRTLVPGAKVRYTLDHPDTEGCTFQGVLSGVLMKSGVRRFGLDDYEDADVDYMTVVDAVDGTTSEIRPHNVVEHLKEFNFQ